MAKPFFVNRFYATSIVTTYNTIILVTALALSACGPSQPKQQAVPQPNPNDPAELQRRFILKVNEAIKVAAPGLKRPVSHTDSTGEIRTYSAEYTGKLTYDIQKTDSIVSPFLGSVSWSIRWYYNGQPTDRPMTLDAHYAYQDGRWIFKDLVRTIPDNKKLPAPEYVGLFQ